MENKLEFLGREGLTTLLTQVNENTTKKLNKAPNGTNDLITNENEISLNYMPKEMVSSLINGGDIYLIGSDFGEAWFTEEASQAGGFLSSDSDEIQNDGGYILHPDFSLSTYGGNYSYDNVIKDGFYFSIVMDESELENNPSSEYSFGGIIFNAEHPRGYIKRVGDHWEEVTNIDEKFLSVVTSVNGSIGKVVLTGETIRTSKNSTESIKDALDGSLKFGGELQYLGDVPSSIDSYWNVIVGTDIMYNISKDNPPMWENRISYNQGLTQIPEGIFFVFTGGYDYNSTTNQYDLPVITNDFAGLYITVGDYLVVKNGAWEKINNTELVNTKLDKAPNGDNYLIDTFSNKINPIYLPEELTKETPLIYGGEIILHGDDNAELSPSEEAALAGGFSTNYDWCTVHTDFSVYQSGYDEEGNSTSVTYDDAIEEGFYFEISGGYSFGGIDVPSDKSIYIKRVGDHWEETKTTETTVVVTNTVNGQNGDVVLTGENITITTDNTTTIKEYIDSKEDKDTTYTIEHNPVDPLKLYLKGSDSSSKVVDFRRTAYVGNSTGTAATGYYKFLSGKLGTSQDANLLLYIDKTITNTASGLLHVHLRKATSGFSQTDVSWLTRRTTMPEDVVGLIANNETGEYALYLYFEGTYNACRVEVLYNAGSMSRDNAYTLHETKTPDDIDTSLLIYSQDKAIVSRATKDGDGNVISTSYKKNTYDGVVKSTASTYGNYYTLLMEVELPNNAHYPEFTSRFNICDIESSSCFSGTFCWYVKRGGGTDGSGTIAQHVRWESLTRPSSWNRLVSTYEVGENSVICRLYYQNHGTWVSLAFSRYDARIAGVNILTDVIGANASEDRFYETISGTQVTSTGPYAVYDENGKRIVNTYYNNATSRTENTFLAAPDGKDGAATFRNITANDLPRTPIHQTSGDSTLSEASYVKIATIVIKNTYQSASITMDVGQGRSIHNSTLSVVFNLQNNLDPTIKSFTYTGEDYSSFLHREDTGIWGLYVKQIAQGDTISILGYNKISTDENVEVSWVKKTGCAEKPEGAIEATYYNNINDYYTNAPITYSYLNATQLGGYIKLLEVDITSGGEGSGTYSIYDKASNFAGSFFFRLQSGENSYAGVKWLDVTEDAAHITKDMPLVVTKELYEGGTKFRVYFKGHKSNMGLVLVPTSCYTSGEFKYITPQSGYRTMASYIVTECEGTIVDQSNRPNSFEYDAAGQKITETYIKDIAVEESTLTYTKGDGTTQSVELQTVNSINGLNGDVTLTGSDINISTDDGTSIKDYVDNVVSGGGNTNLSDLYWGESSLKDYGYYGTESQTIGSIHDADYNVNIDITSPMPTLTTLLCRARWAEVNYGGTLPDNAKDILKSNPYGMIVQLKDDAGTRYNVSSIYLSSEDNDVIYTFTNSGYVEINQQSGTLVDLDVDGNDSMNGSIFVCY